MNLQQVFEISHFSSLVTENQFLLVARVNVKRDEFKVWNVLKLISMSLNGDHKSRNNHFEK